MSVWKDTKVASDSNTKHNDKTWKRWLQWPENQKQFSVLTLWECRLNALKWGTRNIVAPWCTPFSISMANHHWTVKDFFANLKQASFNNWCQFWIVDWLLKSHKRYKVIQGTRGKEFPCWYQILSNCCMMKFQGEIWDRQRHFQLWLQSDIVFSKATQQIGNLLVRGT